jgi:hypothetical protein
MMAKTCIGEIHTAPMHVPSVIAKRIATTPTAHDIRELVRVNRDVDIY